MAKKKLLIAAVMVGLLAMGLMYLYGKQQTKKFDDITGDQVEVVKAARNIQAGTPLTKDRITTELVPRQFLPPNPLEASEMNMYIGTPLAVNVEEGAMILTSDFTRAEVSRTLSSKIPPEERAMSIPVDTISGVSGLLRPGDRIDILGTFPVGDKDQTVTDEQGNEATGYVTMTLLQNVTLLAVGQQISDVVGEEARQSSSYSAVTLAVTIDEAELLTIAQTRGKMTLLLRNREDVQVATITKKTLREVLEDLEVIQEKRKIRQKRKPKKVKKGIDILKGDQN